MEIVYFWIEDFKNLKKIGINFGSEYEFAIDKIDDSAIYLNAKKNEKFVGNFYNNERIANISVLVGMNASGKSNLLSVLRIVCSYSSFANQWAIDKKLMQKKYLLIVKDNNEYHYLTSKNINIDLSKSKLQLSPISINNIQIQSIFYASAIEFTCYPINLYRAADCGVDVSSDYLLYEESKNNQGISTHKHEETLRQIQFIDFAKNNSISGLENTYYPNQLELYSKSMKDSITVEYNEVSAGKKNEVTNSIIRYFRDEFEYMLNKFDSEIDSNGLDDSQKYKLALLNHLLSYLILWFNTSNNKDIIPIGVDREKWLKEYDNMANNWKQNIESEYIKQHKYKSNCEFDILELDGKSFEEVIINFINCQNFLVAKPILEFWKLMKELISKSSLDFSIGSTLEIKVTIDKEDYRDFVKIQDSFLAELNKKSFIGHGFISVDWYGLSKGEKAYLNLFSRFLFAKQQILEQANISNNLLIMLDEGEDGFHLEWQKRYVKNIIDILPEIFQTEKWKPNIQIIFSTHSPISLADVPNDRITYLAKIDEYSKVLKDDERPNTSFADNIHHLMSHTFFQDGGLAMGDFAKQKIKTIQRAIEQGNLSKSLLNQIYLIGEPIIRRQLLKLYEEKKPFDLNERMAQLEHELAKLKNQKENDKN